MTGSPPPRPFEALFRPSSLAVVGASADPAKWGYWLARGALAGRTHRAVGLVNRRGEPVLGQPTVATLRELDTVPELVVVAVPGASYPQVVDEALALGARAVVGVTAGLDEQVSRAVAARVRAAGAVLLGPNCMGVADAAAELSLVWGDLPSGSIALLSQSGNLALELGRLAADEGLGFSRFASLGNEHDVTASDLLETVATDPATRVVALYLEDFSRLRQMSDSALRCVEAGTPVVLLASGRSAAGRRAAATHTGALVGSRAAIEAACRASGVALVDTPTQLVAVAHALTARARFRGRRVGIVGDGGGHGVVAADLMAQARLHVPVFHDQLQDRLRETLPATADVANPVDLAGGGEHDQANYARCVRAVLESGAVDAAVLTGYFGSYGVDDPRLAALEVQVATEMVQVVADLDRPLMVHSMASDSPTCAILRAGGVPVLSRIEGVIAGLDGLAAKAGRTGVPKLPPPAPPVADTDAYVAARRLCEARGVHFPAGEVLAAADDVAAVAEQAAVVAEGLGYPVVAKALGLAHKSDVGGVHLGLMSGHAVREAVLAMLSALGPRPVTVESMVTHRGVELIVGARHEPGVGPLVMVGLGGVQAEVVGDIAVELAPVDRAGALAMLQRLLSYRLLTGFRGAPPVDVDAAAEVVAHVSEVLAEHPEIEALELNPVLVTPAGCLALDAHLDGGQWPYPEGDR